MNTEHYIIFNQIAVTHFLYRSNNWNKL